MPQVLIIALFIVIVSTGWLIGTYNRLIKNKNKIEEAWSSIDVSLKRRHNLIPNLIRAIEGYEAHESEVLKSKYKSLKNPEGISNRVEEESQVSESLRGLLALAEAYPELKASANFLDLQNSVDEIEEDIQKARNRYNRYVGRLNTLIESFPAKYIAQKYGFAKHNYFTLDLATQREFPEIDFSTAHNSKK